MSDLEFIVELLIRMEHSAMVLYKKLPEGWNKGQVIINLTFEDGQLKEEEIY